MGARQHRPEFMTQAPQMAKDVQLLRGALQDARFIAPGTISGLKQPLQHLQQQPSSFYSWRTKLRRGESSAPDSLGAVESMADSPWIALTPPAAQPDETVAWDVELSLPRGVVLRMRAG